MTDNSLFLMKDCCLQTKLTPSIDSIIELTVTYFKEF